MNWLYVIPQSGSRGGVAGLGINPTTDVDENTLERGIAPVLEYPQFSIHIGDQ